MANFWFKFIVKRKKMIALDNNLSENLNFALNKKAILDILCRYHFPKPI